MAYFSYYYKNDNFDSYRMFNYYKILLRDYYKIIITLNSVININNILLIAIACFFCKILYTIM